MIAVHAQPGAKKTEIAGTHGEALKIRLAAPPIEGKANQALLRFIAERLGLRVNQVVIVRGETSREKTLRVPTNADPRALIED